MIELTGALGAAIGLLVIVALLRYVDQSKKAPLGVALVTASAAFLLVVVSFEFFSDILETSGWAVLAEQVKKAGIYIGFTLGGACCIIGALIIALKNLLR